MIPDCVMSIGNIRHIGHRRIMISDCVLKIGNIVQIGYMGHIGLGS